MRHTRICNRDLPLFTVTDGVAHITEYLHQRLYRQQQSICLFGAKSSSGKNFILKKICDQLPIGTALNLDGDDWYYGEPLMSEMQRLHPDLNWDHPSAVDLNQQYHNLHDLAQGKSTEKPCYRKETSARGPKEKIHFKPIVFCGGNFSLYDPAIRKFGDLKIFIITSKHTRLIRRLLRDTTELGWSASEVIKYMIGVAEPMAKKYIDPTIEYADALIENDLIPELEYLQTGHFHAQMKFKSYLSYSHLLKHGATLLSTTLQVDVYLQPDNSGLIASDEIVRIRSEGGKHYFSNKGPKQSNCQFQRPKFSFEIDTQAVEALKTFYTVDCTIIKRRTLYDFDGITIAQDEDIRHIKGSNMRILPPFTEIQLSHNHSASLNKLYEVAKALGLNADENIVIGYAAM